MMKRCGKCGEGGHNARTCDSLQKGREKLNQVRKDREEQEKLNPPNAGTGGGEESPGSPPSTPPMPEKKMSEKEEELISLIGLDATLKLGELGLINKVVITETDKTNLEITNGRYDEPFKIEYGDKTDKISRIVIDSNMTVGDSPSKYSPDAMGQALSNFLNTMLQKQGSQDSKADRVKYLREIMKHMDSLSKVFGFDDQRQLEAFFAAWLMKDSTCRLTGIPGTGKTTVIEAAATLLSNSYGYNGITRVLLDTSQYKNYRKGTKVVPIIFPNGMNYSLDYGNNENLRGLWEEWRFTDWEKNSKVSGAYLYDFTFLQRMRGNSQKEPLKPIEFADTLFANLEMTVIEDEKLDTKTISYHVTSKPIDELTLSRLFKSGRLPPTITKKGDILQYQGKDLYKDAGGNEGFYLRRFLMDYFYDARIDDGNNGISNIAKEMLEEIGIAKIDYDKRAEEILYGIEIRQETSTNKITGNTVSEYKFDPAPRPIVTQPIKFFNEANRSGSGVEDAVLGLIAEKTVEYRGQTFTSPNFVAWMDTNPHQKGNDLAFVDRIDMELYFGTLTLGARFNALNERYSQRQGSDPKSQLINRIMLSDGIKPMRFRDLRTVWGLTNGLFFNASGKPDSEGGALLDISLLSVLFTQRYMPKTDKVKVKYDNNETEHEYADAKQTYFSPLVDISRTTNLQYEKQHDADLKKYLAKDTAQSPALIERMLGFRFTNSLIKMTRALSFLRGKDYVTRQEVIDALPYCVGHRLGPAREGEDPKGRDIGISRDAMTLTNEQEWIKELILEGYVLKKTNSLMGAASEITLFDDWDSFMKRCKMTIEANNELWIYERDILNNIRQAVVSGSGITPVHWHIATMIVENVRNNKTYQENYKALFEKISRPQAVAGDEDMDSLMKAKQIQASKSLYQYYNIRGEIVNDLYLFSDDKMRLLNLIDSKIQSLSGLEYKNPSFKGMSNPNAGSYYQKMTAELATHGFPDLSTYNYRMYNDGLGAWGYLISNGKNKSPDVSLTGGASLLGNEGYMFKANQELSLVGGFYESEKQVDFTIPATFAKKMDSLISVLNMNTENGIVYSNDSGYKVLNDNVKIDTFKITAQSALKGYFSRDGTNVADLDKGLFGCFELKHQPDSSSIPNPMITGDSKLLLWLRLHLVEGKKGGATANPNMIYVGLEIGITSKLAKPISTKKEIRKTPDGTEYEFFTQYEYQPLNEEMLKTDYNLGLLIDSGNLTEKDYEFYVNQILKAITNE